jgi:hypothetical protein
MNPVRCLWIFGACLGVAAACTDSQGFDDPNLPEVPKIVTASGPPGAVVACANDSTDGGSFDSGAQPGGTCPLPLQITFRLPKQQFVWKAIVRFRGDGSDDGIDRAYTLANMSDAGLLVGQVFGNDAADVVADVNALVPDTIVRRGALFTYTVRLVSGAGFESQPSTLTVSVQ